MMGGGTRWIAAVLFAVVACGCGHPGTSFKPPHVQKVAKDRAVLSAGAAPFGSVRSQIVVAAERGVIVLDVQDATRSVRLELPPTPTLDDATNVVVVRIDRLARYGTTKVSDTAALEVAARPDAGAGSIVLLRVADDLTLDQLFATADALRRAGIGHIVLGLVPANVTPPTEGWGACFYPHAALENRESGVVNLEIDWDDERRPGAVRVIDSPGHGFGGAAVLCTLWQRRQDSPECTNGLPCTRKTRFRFRL